MTKSIVIGGVDIATLKAQKVAMQQEANAFVSNAIAEGSALVEKMLKAESEEEANRLAEQALEVFENASLVAGTCGVCFILPYYEEYGQYESEEVMSNQIEDSENEHVQKVWDTSNTLSRLSNVLYSMESDARGWHSSTC